MRRREDKAITKHTLNLYSGDYQFLQVHYGVNIGAAKIIRDLVNMHVKKIQSRSEQVIDPLLEDEVAPYLKRVMEESR